jgi:thiopeptide-type bacteriocin biosynthesis protein
VSVDRSKEFAAWFARWREQWRVPRRVYMSWADNRLLYDLDDPDQVDDLRDELARKKGRGQWLLQEALPAPEHAWLPSANGGRRIAELVVSLGLRTKSVNAVRSAVSDLQRRPASLATSDVRLRPPGSDWLFLKLYGPRSGENELLAGPIRLVCEEIRQAQIANGWFFLRYSDPEPHLRLRFFGVPDQLTSILLPRLCAWASSLITGGQCHKFAFDTYDREIERYGGPEATAASEALFAADSQLVVDLLACAPHLDQTLLAVITIDGLLGALGLENGQRLAWLKEKVTSRKEVAEEYRGMRPSLVTALCDPGQLGAPIVEALSERTSAIAPIVERLAEIESTQGLTQPLSNIYESYLHMHCNRFGIDPARERRLLGLLLRARETIAHLPAVISQDEAVSMAGNKP